MNDQFITAKPRRVNFSLPEFNPKIQVSWIFYLDARFESSNTYDMIIGWDPLGKLSIPLNFNDKTITCNTDTLPTKDRGTLNTQESLIEV